jgi:predicted nucleic acid-binding protein
LGAILKVYLDACVLNRLFDDQSQPRIRAEAEAVQQVLSLILLGNVEWMASRILALEHLQNPDVAKRQDSLDLLSHAGGFPVTSDAVRQRGRLLAAAGYGIFDALHLAQAEEMKVDALLTTDDRFMRLAGRGAGNPTVPVVNPVDWIKEVRLWLRAKQ